MKHDYHDSVYSTLSAMHRKRNRLLLGTVIAFIYAFVLIWMFTGCSHMTVAPKPVYANTPAFDNNTQNAGVIDCDQNGCVVTPGWMDRYHRMETEFKSTIFEDTYIAPEGKNFRVSYAVQNHYAEMRNSERGP